MRHLVDAPAQLWADFDADPGVTTVTVTRDDGTAAITDAVTSGTGTRRTVTLTKAQNSELTILTAVWTSTTYTVTTQHDVVGGHYVTLSAVANSGSVDEESRPALIAARDWAETLVDRYTRRAFTPRYGRFTAYGRGVATLLLPSDLRRIVWATVDDVDLDLDEWTFETWGSVTSDRTFGVTESLAVGYEYGLDACPADLSDAVLTLARYHLLDSKNRRFDRARYVRDSEGFTEFLSTPGPDRPAGLPMVDAVLNAYRDKVPTVA